MRSIIDILEARICFLYVLTSDAKAVHGFGSPFGSTGGGCGNGSRQLQEHNWLAPRWIEENTKGIAMSVPSNRSHEDKEHHDELREERLNPGRSDVEFGAGAASADREGGKAAKRHPLDESDGEQAGTQRDGMHKVE